MRRRLGTTLLVLGGLATVAAVLRYFMRGWLEPLGVPTVVGSLLASVTVVLLAAVLVLFGRAGRAGRGYWATAVAYLVLALWCELLVIGGILVSERTGARTYYQGPWAAVTERFPTPAAHALGHAQGFLPRTAIGLGLGGLVYAVARCRRSTGGD